MDDKPELLLKNIMKCSICGGNVDKYKYDYECDNCGAIGDPYIGMIDSFIIKEE